MGVWETEEEPLGHFSWNKEPVTRRGCTWGQWERKRQRGREKEWGKGREREGEAIQPAGVPQWTEVCGGLRRSSDEEALLLCLLLHLLTSPQASAQGQECF